MILYSNTFGANRYKLEESGYTVDEVIGAGIRNLKRAIEKSGKEAYAALDVGPLGRLMEPGGDLSFEEAYDVFAEIIRAGKDADLIVIFGGTNDYGYNTPLGDENDKTDVSFYGALYEMLTGLKAEHPKAVIVFMTPLHRVEFGGLSVDKQKNDAGYTLYHYIDAIKKQCENLEIPVIDTNTVYGLNPTDKYVKDNYLTDGLHPNEEGHKILAERIASCFEDL